MTRFTAAMDRIHNQLTGGRAGSPMAKALGESEPAGTAPKMTGEQFMANALSAQVAGHITGAQLSECELRINAGKQPDARIAKAVLTSTAYSPWG